MNVAQIKREYRELPTARLVEPAKPSRSSMDDEKMDDLVASIRSIGVIQPLSVARVGDDFEVIAGHRRFIASQRAGLAVVPCIVYPSKEAALLAVQHAENRIREEQTPADEALWYAELLETIDGGDVDVLCGLVNEKRGRVEARLNLLRGDDQIFKALEASKIGVGVAEQLNRCTDLQHRRMLLHQAVHGGATVAVVSGWIAEWKAIHQPATQGLPNQAPAPAPGPIMQTDFFTCALCKKTDNVHLMRPVNFHTFCEQAMFADMLEMWNRRHEFTRYPRTLDDAVELVNELVDRFPQLLEQEPRRI